MIIWVDDVRKPPDGCDVWCPTVEDAITTIKAFLYFYDYKEEYILDLDHDAGTASIRGGDYIKILDWLEETGFGKYFKYHIHSMNPVGRENMRNIIRRNNWIEVY